MIQLQFGAEDTIYLIEVLMLLLWRNQLTGELILHKLETSNLQGGNLLPSGNGESFPIGFGMDSQWILESVQSVEDFKARFLNFSNTFNSSINQNVYVLIEALTTKLIVIEQLRLSVKLASIPEIDVLPEELSVRRKIPHKKVQISIKSDSSPWIPVVSFQVFNYSEIYSENILNYLCDGKPFILAPGAALGISVEGTNLLSVEDSLTTYGIGHEMEPMNYLKSRE